MAPGAAAAAKSAEPKPAPRALDVAVRPALARAIPIVDLAQSASTEQRPSAIVTSGGQRIAPRGSSIEGLVTAAAETVVEATGTTSNVTERAPAIRRENPVARPPATQRVLRRMNAARPSFDADMRACADEHGTREATTVTLQLSVSPEGTVEDAKPTSSTPAPLLACVSAAITKAQFGPPGRAGASAAIRVVVPAAKTPAPPEAVAAEPDTKAPASAPN